MLEKQLLIQNELGVHARVANKITRCSGQFKCSITAINDGKEHNLKNVVSAMLLNGKNGDMINVIFDGEDEESASIALEELFNDKFGES